MALIACKECGKQISDQAAACPNCGVPIAGGTPVSVALVVPRSRSVAILLAILLGTFGAHKFYLHSPGQGFVYLLLCWTLIPTITGFLEGLYYLFMSDQKFQEKYGQPTPSQPMRSGRLY